MGFERSTHNVTGKQRESPTSSAKDALIGRYHAHPNDIRSLKWVEPQVR